MEQNRKPINRHVNTVNWSLAEEQGNSVEQRKSFWWTMLELEICKWKYTHTHTHTHIYTYMDHRPECKIQIYKTSRRGENIWLWVWWWLSTCNTRVMQRHELLKKMNKLNFIEIKIFFCAKDTVKRMKTSHRVGKCICKRCQIR